MPIETKILNMSDLEPNQGQIEGLPRNPRLVKDDHFRKLVKSIKENPEMLQMRELLVYPHEGKYVIIGGNMRYMAMKSLRYKKVHCKVIPEEATISQLTAYTIKDNSGFGEWDFSLLANEWDMELLEDCCIDIPSMDMTDIYGDDEDSSEDDEDDEDSDDGLNYMDDDITIRDVIYDSNNDFEIPSLLIERQAGRLELPVTPWGANSRLTKDVATYHFYVDDYRFNKLFKDPSNLITSGCKAIVEPNCSLHDQTPIAYGLHLIYKKRWIARYCQELGIDVYADLNVAEKFREYNRLGIPQGYNAFMTRGLTGFIKSLENDLKEAQEISGLEHPNLLVYGGGKDIKEFCKEHSLLYVQDFINA